MRPDHDAESHLTQQPEITVQMDGRNVWLTFGMGDRRRGNVEVTWPSGLVERFPDMAARQTVNLVEGTGIRVESMPWDVNSDGGVDIFNLVHAASQFGPSGDALYGDVNGDG